MSDNTILTYAERMTEDMRGAIELAHLPGGVPSLEKELIEATTIEVTDIASLARVISFANAAFVIADLGIDGVLAPWCREVGVKLLRSAMVGLSVIEADREPRPTAGLN